MVGQIAVRSCVKSASHLAATDRFRRIEVVANRNDVTPVALAQQMQ
jgi:hypothetical protein